MKTLLLCISTIFLVVSCQAESSQEITPEFVKVAGKWRLYKISGGFRSPNSLGEIPITNEETIEFDASTKVFTRTIAGKVTETTNFDVRAINNFNNTSAREAIVFTKSNTYSWVSFEESTSSLVLYQSTPIGAELADGNSFYYRKVN